MRTRVPCWPKAHNPSSNYWNSWAWTFAEAKYEAPYKTYCASARLTFRRKDYFYPDEKGRHAFKKERVDYEAVDNRKPEKDGFWFHWHGGGWIRGIAPKVPPRSE